MKVIIASDSFKECCTSLEAACAFERGILRTAPDTEVIKIAVADGGEGTVDALVQSAQGQRYTIDVCGPLGERQCASYGIIDKTTAIIEMAQASGLPLIPQGKLNPLVATTYGTGELICDALDRGCTKIVIGIGGSATNDGGAGMAQALGFTLLDKSDTSLNFGGGELGKLATIDCSRSDPRLKRCEIIALCDVSNPLTGPDGASHVYGPQKGASRPDCARLDANLSHFAKVIHAQLGKDILATPGSGAAGGLGAGLIAFCDALLKPGIDTVLSLTRFESHCTDADLVITGEGQIDRQSAFGKVPVGVARIAKRYNLPVIAIVGSIGEGAETVYEHGIDTIMSIVRSPMSLEESIGNFGVLAADAAERVMRMVGIMY